MADEDVAQDEFSVAPVVTTVLERTEDPSRDGLGSGVKKILARAEGVEWPITRFYTTLVHRSDEFYAADSTKKPGEEAPRNRRGDLKAPAHEVRYWWIEAVHPPLHLGFSAGWKEGLTPKGGRSFQFQSAHCADPIGVYSELIVDYSLGASKLKRVKDEPEWAHQERVARLIRAAEERDRRYNRGDQWLNRLPMISSFKEFDIWTQEAVAMIARIPTHQREDIAA